MSQNATQKGNDFLGNPSLIQTQEDLQLAMNALVTREMDKVNQLRKMLGVKTFDANDIDAQVVNLLIDADRIMRGIPGITAISDQELDASIEAGLQQEMIKFLNSLPPEVQQRLNAEREAGGQTPPPPPPTPDTQTPPTPDTQTPPSVERQNTGDSLRGHIAGFYAQPNPTKEDTRLIMNAIRRQIQSELTNGGTIPMTPELTNELKTRTRDAIDEFSNNAPQSVKDFITQIRSEKANEVTQQQGREDVITRLSNAVNDNAQSRDNSNNNLDQIRNQMIHSFIPVEKMVNSEAQETSQTQPRKSNGLEGVRMSSTSVLNGGSVVDGNTQTKGQGQGRQ